MGNLVRQIDQAKAQFSRQDFLKRVFDPDFVPQKRYAELLVAEIPIGQRLEVFLDVFRAKEEWKTENMRHFFDALLLQLTEEERKQVKDAISQELRTADDETTIRLIIGSFSGDIWPGIDEVVRLRIENRLVRSIREGRFDRKQSRCRGGALGTWGTRILPYFSLKQDVLRAIHDKLSSNSEEEEDYVFQYLFSYLKYLTDQMPPFLEYTFKRKLIAGDSRFYEALALNSPWGNLTWNAEFTEAYENFCAAESSNDDNPDDIPF